MENGVEIFNGLRKDLLKLSLGTYFAQVTEIISQEDIPNPELLSTLLNCLYMLSTKDISLSLVKAVFELRVACIAGYTPDLNACGCGSGTTELFDVSEGCVVCVRCAKYRESGIRMPVAPGVLESMRYISMCESKRLFSFKIGNETADELSQVTEVYLATQLERCFSTLDFYKTLLI